MNKQTQRSKLLCLLESFDRPGRWVSLPSILALGIAQYNARIFELRSQGYVIENKIEKHEGATHSWFRLVAYPTKYYQEDPLSGDLENLERVLSDWQKRMEAEHGS